MTMIERWARWTLVLTLAVPVCAAAVEVGEGIAVGAHVRTRVVRHDGKDGDSSNKAVEYVENRVRLSLDAKAGEWFRAFAQLQDVRVWGEETSTLFDYSANGLDLHQGYGDFVLGSTGAVLRLGRQEIALDGQRLVGAVGWTPQARSFDAARVWWKGMGGDLRLEGFYAHLLDTESAVGPYPTNGNTDFTLFAGAGGVFEAGGTTSSLWALVDHRLKTGADRDRATIGLRHGGKFGLFRYRVEGYYQLGDLAGQSIGAFMAGADVGVVLKSAKNLDIRLWADYLSGDDDPNSGDVKTFDTLFATNHKFYGFADYFLNVPAHTGGKGLIDLALKMAARPLDQLTLKLDGHYFMPADDQGGPSAFGTEIDFVAVWKPARPIGVLLGVFVMLPDDGLVEAQTRVDGKDADLGLYFQVQGDL